MYTKLILRNAKRSAKDYLIYVVTLTLCVGLFYAFLSITSKHYNPDAGPEYNLDITGDMMRWAVLGVTTLLLFLVKYVNTFMIRRKQKEFAIQTVLGMEQKTTARLFFAETLIMGFMSICFGIPLGVALSQIINAMLLTTYGMEITLSFLLFPDTILITFASFLFVFSVIGVFNAGHIRKIKIIDMLHADKITETDFKKSKWMPGLIVLCLLVAASALNTGINVQQEYYDNALILPLRIMYWGNILAPASLLLSGLIFLVYRIISQRTVLNALVFTLMVICLPTVYFNTIIVGNARKYSLPIHGGINNSYLLYAVLFLIFIICCFFYLISDGINVMKKKSVKLRYHGENLFLFGQIIAKLKTTSKTTALICITLTASIVLLVVTSALAGWAEGYLDSRSIYDVQTIRQYTDEVDENGLPEDYRFMISSLEAKGIEIADYCLIPTYSLDFEVFYSLYNKSFPVLAVSVTDLNHLRDMLGYPRIQLAEDEFATQWEIVATEQEIEEFLAEYKTIQANGTELLLAEESCYRENIGESLYRSSVLLILPDSICKNLKGVNLGMFIDTVHPIPNDDAVELEAYFETQIPQLSGAPRGNLFIRFRTLQLSGTIALLFVLRSTVMIYTAVVLLIICFTIMSLQQLSDAFDFSYRFSVLRKMGVDDTGIDRLILYQMLFWFGLPILVAIIAAVIIIIYVIQIIYAQVSAYMGMTVFFANVAATAAILLVLFCCYFVSSWVLFKRNIAERRHMT